MGAISISTAVIADGATTSQQIDLREYELVALQADASFDGATISFLGCACPEPGAPDSPGFDAVVDSAGSAVSITITDDRYILLTEAQQFLLRGLAWIKVVSASTETGAQNLRLICRRAL